LGEKQQKVFEKLKKKFTMKPVLVTSDLDKEMRVEIDASDFGMEGVLGNNEWQIEDRLVLKEEKIYVPKVQELRLKIIWLHYDTSIVEYREQ